LNQYYFIKKPSLGNTDRKYIPFFINKIKRIKYYILFLCIFRSILY